MTLTVALAQLPVVSDIEVNLKEIKSAVDFARDKGAQIVLTPEGSLSGYTHDFDRNHLEEALSELETYAKESRVGLALGTCRYEPDGLCYNQLRFYAPDGEFLGFHTKTLLCGSLDNVPKGEINNYACTPLRVFNFGGITIGGLICNDMWGNPFCTPMDDIHLALRLSRMGARVIFHAVNGGRDTSDISQVTVKRFHETNLLLRSAAAGVYTVSVDNAYPLDIPVSSIGGVACPNIRWGMTLPETGRQFGVYTINL